MLKFIFNKKKLGVILLVVGLMLVMFGTEGIFKNRLKFTSFIQYNIKSLTQYEALDKKLTYKLSSEWKTQKQNFQGNEIIYHNDFFSDDSKIHGFVQVWNKKEDIKEFLEKSKAASLKQNDIQNYNADLQKINKNDVWLITYIIKNQDGNNYIAYEYFFDEGNNFIRFSFFVREENFKSFMPSMFNAIVKTMEYRK